MIRNAETHCGELARANNMEGAKRGFALILAES